MRHFEMEQEFPPSQAWGVANPLLAAAVPKGPLLLPDAGTFLKDYSLPENQVAPYDEDTNEVEKPCPRTVIKGTPWEHDFPPVLAPLRPLLNAKK